MNNDDKNILKNKKKHILRENYILFSRHNRFFES
jgi:hypothetical protein